MGTIPTLSKFAAGTPIVASVMNSHFDAIVTVVNGQLSDVNIQQISAGKVTSGVFHPDRVQALFDSGGVVGTTRVSLDAAKITGVLDIERLPTSATANRVLKVGTANSAPTYSQVAFGELTGSIAPSQIPNGDITNGKLANRTGPSVMGRATNTSGVVADISAATNGHVLRRNNAAIGFGTIGDDSISGLGANKLTGTLSSDRLPATISGNRTFSGNITISGALILPVL